MADPVHIELVGVVGVDPTTTGQGRPRAATSSNRRPRVRAGPPAAGCGCAAAGADPRRASVSSTSFWSASDSGRRRSRITSRSTDRRASSPPPRPSGRGGGIFGIMGNGGGSRQAMSRNRRWRPATHGPRYLWITLAARAAVSPTASRRSRHDPVLVVEQGTRRSRGSSGIAPAHARDEPAARAAGTARGPHRKCASQRSSPAGPAVRADRGRPRATTSPPGAAAGCVKAKGLRVSWRLRSGFRRLPGTPEPHFKRRPTRARKSFQSPMASLGAGCERRQNGTEDPVNNDPCDHHRDRLRPNGQGPGLHRAPQDPAPAAWSK